MGGRRPLDKLSDKSAGVLAWRRSAAAYRDATEGAVRVRGCRRRIGAWRLRRRCRHCEPPAMGSYRYPFRSGRRHGEAARRGLRWSRPLSPGARWCEAVSASFGRFRPRMQRGDIWFAATPGGDRPVLVLTRDPVAGRIGVVVVAAFDPRSTRSGVRACAVGRRRRADRQRGALRQHSYDPSRFAPTTGHTALAGPKPVVLGLQERRSRFAVECFFVAPVRSFGDCVPRLPWPESRGDGRSGDLPRTCVVGCWSHGVDGDRRRFVVVDFA